MPPSSQRRTRTRKVHDAQERSDADDVDSVSTPSRKRRRVNNREPAASPNTIVAPNSRSSNPHRGKPRPSDTKGSEDEPSENSAEEDINFVIRNLRSAKHNIQARVDYANEVHEVTYPQGKQAYAKIAGNGWTFYVDILQVRIGRPPDGRQGETSQSGFSDGDGDTSLVHIDLGPSKHVSRQHAEIRYDDNTRNWYIVVNGRNGVKLDETPLRRGETATLNSGSVIDVAGTQMIFITPNDEPAVHPAIWAQTRAMREGNEEEDEDDFDAIGAPPPPQRTPNQSQGSRFNHNRPSSGRDNQSGHPSSSKGQSQNLQASLTLGQHDGSYDSRSQSSHTKLKTSPPFSKMILEQSDDIDYAQDSAKDLKPPHSYAQLIGMAILSSPEEKLTLSKIYDWIKERYAFYRHSGGGWQNSIRHNLSLNKCFEKVARRTDEPGKGMKWQIVPEHRDEFLKKGLNNPRKLAGRSSSGPNSPVKTTAPSSMDNPFSQDYQQESSRPSKSLMKTSPDSTPPLSHYPASKQAYTPDRGGNIFSQLQGGNTSSPRNDVLSGISPLPFTHRKPRAGGLNEAATAGSPSGPAMLLNSDPNDHLVTPLFTRHAPRLAPPSTAHLPSQFMPMSSPAPFWKYAEFGSTPARPGVDVSPAKGLHTNGPKLETHTDLTSGKRPSLDEKLSAVRSSSPPFPEGEVGSGSPTKALSHRATEPSSQQQAKVQPPPPQPAFAPPSRGGLETSGTPAQEDDDEEEEEGMIDLARGFQPIGSFHRNMSAGIRGN